MKQRLLAILAYVLPTFPLGYFWHLTFFADRYKELEVYRDDLIFPLGLFSMLVQGVVWAIVYERMFAGESVLKGAFKFGALAFALAWSYMVVAVAAKHRMASVGGFVAVETGFVALHYAIVSPLIARVYSRREQRV